MMLDGRMFYFRRNVSISQILEGLTKKITVRKERGKGKMRVRDKITNKCKRIVKANIIEDVTSICMN